LRTCNDIWIETISATIRRDLRIIYIFRQYFYKYFTSNIPKAPAGVKKPCFSADSEQELIAGHAEVEILSSSNMPRGHARDIGAGPRQSRRYRQYWSLYSAAMTVGTIC
jgi:hypothetical protein